MPRRIQAIALLLLLVLSPIAGAQCGMRCLAVTPELGHAHLAAQHACLRASSCCPAKPTVCSATSASDSTPLPSPSTSAAQDAAAASVSPIAAILPPARVALLSASGDSPPIQFASVNPVPLRI